MEDLITVCAHCHVIEEKLKKTYPGSKVIKIMRRTTMDTTEGAIDNSVLSRVVYFNHILPDTPTPSIEVVLFCSIVGYECFFESMIALKALKEVVKMCESHKKD